MATEQFYSFEPDYVVIPGETVLETIESLGITQVELALRTGRPRKTINGIIKGNTAITPETALQFERVLGVPARFWINLESNYQQDLAEINEEKKLEGDIDWLRKFPVNEICNRGYMEETRDEIKQLKNILNFFGVASVSSWDTVWDQNVAFRKTEAFKTDEGSLATWIRMVEIEALQIECEPYNTTNFREKLMEIRSLTVEKDPNVFQGKLKELCSDAGVAVVFMPEIKGSRVSGVTKWLSSNKAMIGLSLRHKSNDHLWFTFFHEAAHILLHGKKSIFIEGAGTEMHESLEIEANDFAANVLIPRREYERFKSVGRSFSQRRVEEFAKEIGIAPGIIVGRLQRERLLPYSHLNRLKDFYSWKE